MQISTRHFAGNYLGGGEAVKHTFLVIGKFNGPTRFHWFVAIQPHLYLNISVQLTCQQVAKTNETWRVAC